MFSQVSKLKKSAEVYLALPPAENMVSLWNIKEYEASSISGEHDSLKTKSSRRNPLPRDQFLTMVFGWAGGRAGVRKTFVQHVSQKP